MLIDFCKDTERLCRDFFRKSEDPSLRNDNPCFGFGTTKGFCTFAFVAYCALYDNSYFSAFRYKRLLVSVRIRITTIIAIKIIGIVLLGFFFLSCSRQPEILEQVKKAGEIRVIVRDNLTTCYRWENGFTGFECTLAQRFADELGVRLKVVMVRSDEEAIHAIRQGRGHLIAGLKVTSRHSASVRFGPSYRQIRQQLVYRRGNKRLKNIGDLDGVSMEIARDCECTNALRKIRAEGAKFDWREHSSSDTEELLSLVLQRKVAVTVVDSHEAALMRQLYPALDPGFVIGEPLSLAWAFPPGVDNTLYAVADGFFGKMKESGELTDIRERYYEHMERFNYTESRKFLHHVRYRLPKYIEYFKTAAIRHGVDWHLLGAIGYQESHWNPKAVSPTGVRGIMMLTVNTTRLLGLNDRTDEKQSIFGGARYFAYLKKRLPKRINDPNRTWLALASYNVGFGHVEDTRVLTQRAGANPDRWGDVREFLPLISKKKWYTRTRYGYARGHEPVQYVRNIRRYYDKLLWLDKFGWKHLVDERDKAR
uniref:Membrane-bound lytic murein transglycosylase F n=1 Tax=Candidatus Kentrum sp. MB TaxID=2138164 RepID=A0A450XWN0_9GAMM|nr:MAG: membrane-bound lytic murein transglycosylase F [Candidatus Kentron sp. MB]VFK33682.1 MAG: membrane-bound lytic murein transglycosylase F [Candidatus Kentron sp. MB]VFK76300.1 MAG: membrane-bound lytic murein transglycosylase F [Candidatus Kentron sp. MB]